MGRKKFFLWILLLTVAVFVPCRVCCAEEGVVLSQAYVQENCMDVFITGEMDADNLSFKVSNHAAAVVDSGLISEKDVIVRTIVLLDTSASIPATVRDDVLKYIAYLIDNVGEKEQVKLMTFGEEITVLQDFTSDRYDLFLSMDGVSFDGKQSKIYDALYNTIPVIQSVEGKPCFFHTIVITDGMDESASGVTKEELYLKLQNSKYPIDVVSVGIEAASEPSKEMEALLRMGGGRYVNIYPQADIATIYSQLALDDTFWVRAEIPDSVLDGAVRQINLTDGDYSVQFDLKVAVYDAPLIPIPETDDERTLAGNENIDYNLMQNGEQLAGINAGESEAVPVLDDSKQLPKTLEGSVFIAIIIGGILVIFVTISVMIIAVRSKKKKGIHGQEYREKAEPHFEKDGGRTEFMGDDQGGANYTISLSCPNMPGRIWTFSVDDEIVIGRDANATIQLDDRSVSREQCKIVVHGAGLCVVHLSHTNKTMLNGEVVCSIAPLQSGDILRFGRESLHIDYIQSVGEQICNVEDNKKGLNDNHSSNTMCVF